MEHRAAEDVRPWLFFERKKKKNTTPVAVLSEKWKTDRE
jgi:hypothetical protein